MANDITLTGANNTTEEEHKLLGFSTTLDQSSGDQLNLQSTLKETRYKLKNMSHSQIKAIEAFNRQQQQVATA